MPADRRAWHHVVITTYGAWLPGDPRGFRTKRHREHVEGDYRKPPPAGSHALRLERSKSLLQQGPVTLAPRWRAIVGKALCEKLERLGAGVLAIAVARRHAHLLVKLPALQVRNRVGQAKKHATFVLREHGWAGLVWGARSKVERIRERKHQVAAFHYILRHASDGAWVLDNRARFK